MEGCIIHEVLISPLAVSGMTYEVLISPLAVSGMTYEVLISPLAVSGMTYEVLISQFLPGRLDLRGFDLRKDNIYILYI